MGSGRRVFLLGLDGASWNVLDRMFDAGVMPNLRRLCDEGVRARLASTIPPVTPVAWTSLMTGANPGRHGIFGFLRASEHNSYLHVPVNRLDARVPTIFDYYRDEGRLISLNLPMSYPATPGDALMVTGMMTPLVGDAAACHPGGLLERFRSAGIDYVIDPKLQEADADPERMMTGWQGSRRAFAERLGRITAARMRAVHLLMDEEAWDVFVCVVVGTDRLQHLHWDDLMPEDGGPPAADLAAYYAAVDRHIGDLARRLDPEDTLLIVSDHGFTRCQGSFQANAWLRGMGWLEPRRARRSPLYLLKRVAGVFGLTRERLGRVLGEAGVAGLQLVSAGMDWPRAHAWLSAPFGIRLNVAGRETRGRIPEGEREAWQRRIMAALRECRDDRGRLFVDRVFRREDLYCGDAVGEAPDVVFTVREDCNYSAYAGEIAGPVFRETPFKTGDHRLDGILVAAGGGVRNLREELRFDIVDVLPTLMHLNGRAVPGICDGRVLSEILADDRPVRGDAEWRRYLSGTGRVRYAGGQQDEIRERLKALGYISEDRE